MGILSRFKNIMSANIHALLDEMEDPSKMIDQTMRQLAKDLCSVKRETSVIMAEETRTRREADANIEAAKKQVDLARKALTAGNEDHARVFLNKKNELEAQGVGLQQAAEIAQANAVQMRQMHDKLVKDIQALQARKATIKSNIALTKAAERVNELNMSGSKAESALQTFDRLEKQAQERLDRARALTTLNEVPRDEANALAEIYKNGGGAALDDEISALKAEMGLAPAGAIDDEIAALYAEMDITDADE